MRDFRNLDVWHKSHAFTLNIFHASENFPKTETFQLAATLRRGAMALTMKIAEACGYDTATDYLNGLSRARAVGVEIEYALLLARDLDFLKSEPHSALLAQLIEVRRMLTGLIKNTAVSSSENARQ
jgi:four helix bundle protein